MFTLLKTFTFSFMIPKKVKEVLKGLAIDVYFTMFVSIGYTSMLLSWVMDNFAFMILPIGMFLHILIKRRVLLRKSIVTRQFVILCYNLLDEVNESKPEHFEVIEYAETQISKEPIAHYVESGEAVEVEIIYPNQQAQST